MDSLSIFFIVTTILSLILINLTRKQRLSLVFAIGGLLGSIIGYAIKYIPTIWEKPFDRPNVPTYEKFIIINLSLGEWLMVLIIVLIFLSISKLYEEKLPKALPPTDEEAKKRGWWQFRK